MLCLHQCAAIPKDDLLSLSLPAGSLSMAIFSMISVSFWSRRSSSAPWILHNEYVIPEGTRSLRINAEGNLCCCCCSSFAAVCTAAHICYRTKAAGLLDWKRPAGSDLGALAVRDRLCSEPVVMQRLEWYRWLWRDSHLRSCWNPSLLKKKDNPDISFVSCLQIKAHSNPLGTFKRCGTNLKINPCKGQNRNWMIRTDGLDFASRPLLKAAGTLALFVYSRESSTLRAAGIPHTLCFSVLCPVAILLSFGVRQKMFQLRASFMAAVFKASYHVSPAFSFCCKRVDFKVKKHSR